MTRNRVVCTVAVGEVGRRLHDLTRPSQLDWARRIGADYRVLRSGDGYALGHKLRVGELLQVYDRVCYLDADAFVSESAENLFSLVPEDQFGIHDDAPFLKSTDWLHAEQAAICASQGWEQPEAKCLNTGVMVFGRAHAQAFELPTAPYPVSHCAEQHIVGINLARHRIPLFRLGRSWNWQWWIDPKREHVDGVRVRHFAKAPNTTEEQRVLEMERFAYPDRVARLGRRCLHLADRTERRHGCNGWRCAHRCELGLPAVPGGYCQTCSSFTDDGPF
jgi:hypothetical protein